MRVLVLESEPGLADEVIDELETSGHLVARCHDADRPPFPCRGMQPGQKCPLDEAPTQVAVALDGQLSPGADPPTGHDGARCALRRSVPLVVAGPRAATLVPWASKTCQTFHPGVVVSAIEEVGDAPLARHGTAATEALCSVLEIHGLPTEDASAEVTQTDDGLRITLKPGLPDLEQRVREVASIRALAKVRELDPHAPRVGVCVD